MKNAHPVPKEEAGAPGMGVAIVTRPAKSDNSASEHADLVTVDDADRLAVAGQLLADVALHIGTARAMLRELADTDPVHGVADLLAVAGWLADFGASMAGEPGHAGSPADWFMRPTTRAAVDALGVKVRA